MRPPDTPNEELLVKQQEKIAKRKERALNIELKCMFRASAPSLLKLYPYLRHAKKVDARILINEIAIDPDMEKALHQRLLDEGMTYADAVRHIEFIKKTSMTYEFMSYRNTQCLSRIFTTALHDDATWKHDGFDEL